MTEAERAHMVAQLEAAAAAGALGGPVPRPLPSREDIAAALMAKGQDIKPGVPRGLEGTPGPDDIDLIQEQQRAQKQRYDDAWLKADSSGYGENARSLYGMGPYDASNPTDERNVLIPGTGELMDKAMVPIHGAVAAASSFPNGMGAALRPGPMMETAKHMFQSKLPALYERLAGSAPGASVPVMEGGLAAKEEAAAIEAFIKSNKGQIKGPDGKRLTKAQQRELVSEWLAQGGRLPEAGPWGRDIRAETLDAIQTQIGKRKP